MNEEGTVKQVVTAAREFADVIVVDDGSTDDTFQQALQAGAIVCRLEVNSGYDSALNIGVMKALDLGYARCITLDADGQHDPSIIRAFDLEMNCGAVVVAGRRPHKQRISESLFAMWSRSVMGIHDPLCGMKAYDLNFVDMIGHFDSYRSIGTELLITAAATERTIAELHVPVRPRSDSPRFASAIRANWRIVRALLLGILKYRGLRRHRR
jgi:glycosyltransferase involved in cell wall biosynthesis